MAGQVSNVARTQATALEHHEEKKAEELHGGHLEHTLSKQTKLFSEHAEHAEHAAQAKAANYVASKQAARAVAAKQAASAPKADAEFNPNIISKLLKSYMSAVDLKTLLAFCNSKKLSQEKLDELLKNLLSAPEEEATSIIDGFLSGDEFNMAEIFAVLSFLLDEVSKKEQGKRKKTLALLQELLEKLSQQNSAFLSEFFALTQNALVAQSPKMAGGLANLSSGNISIASLKNTLKFVEEYLDADFENLVSKCIRLRVHTLARLTAEHLSFEDKSELGNYLRCEKNLILINSVYAKFNKFREEIHEDKIFGITLSADNIKAINSVLNFAENLTVSNLVMRSFLQGIGAGDSLLSDANFKNRILKLFEQMPASIFIDSATRQKVLAGIRSLKSTDDTQNPTDHFKFIRRSKNRVNEV